MGKKKRGRYVEMIKNAFSNLKDTGNGLSVYDLSKYIRANFNVPDNRRFDCWLNKALKEGIDQKIFEHGSNQSRYKLHIMTKNELNEFKKMEKQKEMESQKDKERQSWRRGKYKYVHIENAKFMQCTECKRVCPVSKEEYDLFLDKKVTERLCRHCVAWRGCDCGIHGRYKYSKEHVYTYCSKCCKGICNFCNESRNGLCFWCQHWEEQDHI